MWDWFITRVFSCLIKSESYVVVFLWLSYCMLCRMKLEKLFLRIFRNKLHIIYDLWREYFQPILVVGSEHDKKVIMIIQIWHSTRMKSGPTTDHSSTLLSMTDETCSEFSQAVNKKSFFWFLRLDCTILANHSLGITEYILYFFHHMIFH
jgi:hypothetical protein